jgi:hypothetical protein
MAESTKAKNQYLDSVIPKYYRMQTLDTMCFVFIDTYRFLFPSVTLLEAAEAFQKRYNIDEDLHSAKSLVQTHQRVNQHLFDAERRDNAGK